MVIVGDHSALALSPHNMKPGCGKYVSRRDTTMFAKSDDDEDEEHHRRLDMFMLCEAENFIIISDFCEFRENKLQVSWPAILRANLQRTVAPSFLLLKRPSRCRYRGLARSHQAVNKSYRSLKSASRLPTARASSLSWFSINCWFTGRILFLIPLWALEAL